MNNNVMLGFPTRADSATLSGGSWEATLPLTNLQNRVYGDVARSADLLLASTQFDVDLLQSRNIQVVSLVNHNFTIPARVRIRASMMSDFSTTVYDSGWGNVWPELYPYGTLEWEDDNWWEGSYTAEEIEGYTATLIRIMPGVRLARYLRIEIDNQTNSAGYIQIGRLLVTPAWQPALNMIYGESTGWETKTTIQESLSGAESFNRTNPFRVQRFELAVMEQDEAFAKAFELQRKAGIDKEIVYIHNPFDTFHAIRRQFVGRLRQLNQIEHPHYNVYRTPFEVKELL